MMLGELVQLSCGLIKLLKPVQRHDFIEVQLARTLGFQQASGLIGHGPHLGFQHQVGLRLQVRRQLLSPVQSRLKARRHIVLELQVAGIIGEDPIRVRVQVIQCPRAENDGSLLALLGPLQLRVDCVE
jgi:hypothetical protein